MAIAFGFSLVIRQGLGLLARPFLIRSRPLGTATYTSGMVCSMTCGFDVALSLARGVLDRGLAWKFIRSFEASWGGPLADGGGISVAEWAIVSLGVV